MTASVTTAALDLSEYEASKARLRQIEAAEKEAAAEQSAHFGPKGHRPRSGGNEAARRTGLSRQEVQRTKRHVEAAEKEAKQAARVAHPDKLAALDDGDEGEGEAIA